MPAQSPSAVGYAEDTVVPSAVRTASGSTNVQVGFGGANTLRAQLHVTASAGVTPTLDVVIEDTLDGVNWNTIATFTQLTTTGRQVVNVTSVFADRLRVRWTIGGTAASFTFSVILVSQSALS